MLSASKSPDVTTSVDFVDEVHRLTVGLAWQSALSPTDAQDVLQFATGHREKSSTAMLGAGLTAGSGGWGYWGGLGLARVAVLTWWSVHS